MKTSRFAILLLCALAPLSASADALTSTSSFTSADGGTITLAGKASTTTPYENQPILYTVRCVVRGGISDISLGDLKIGNAIVEMSGKPDVYNEVENGQEVRVAEFRYVITPLQPGKITVPSVVLKGRFEPPDLTSELAGPFGRLSSGVRQALNFFNAYGSEPFQVASSPTMLTVRRPAAAMDPWLPLTSLKIIEDSDASHTVHVGEPLTRKITVLADSAAGSQLPNLDAQQDRTNFRVYADRPTMGEDVDKKSGVIFGWRKESYSLVPQKAGRLVLPAIKVSWWDIVGNKAATAQLPARTIDVLPGVAVRSLPAADKPATDQSAAPRSAPARWPVMPGLSAIGRSVPWYGLLGLLAAVLLLAVVWGLWRRIRRSGAKHAAVRGANRARQKLASRSAIERSLEHVRTAEDLKVFLQAYAHERWGVSKNASLERIFSTMAQSGPQRDDVQAIIKGLAGALYAGKTADIDDLKKRSRRIIAALKNQAARGWKKRETLPRLNPT